jgi:hypothetical protein
MAIKYSYPGGLSLKFGGEATIVTRKFCISHLSKTSKLSRILSEVKARGYSHSGLLRLGRIRVEPHIQSWPEDGEEEKEDEKQVASRFACPFRNRSLG